MTTPDFTALLNQLHADVESTRNHWCDCDGMRMCNHCVTRDEARNRLGALGRSLLAEGGLTNMVTALEAQIARNNKEPSPYQNQLHPGKTCDWCQNCVWKLGRSHELALKTVTQTLQDAFPTLVVDG